MELRSGKGRHDNTTGVTNWMELDTGQRKGEDMKENMENKDGKGSKENDNLEDTKTAETKETEEREKKKDSDDEAYDAIMDDSDDTAERQWFKDQVKAWRKKEARRSATKEPTVNLTSSNDEDEDSGTDESHDATGYTAGETKQEEEGSRGEYTEMNEQEMLTPLPSPDRTAVPHVTPKLRDDENSTGSNSNKGHKSDSDTTDRSIEKQHSENGSEEITNPPETRRPAENPYKRQHSQPSSVYKPTFTDILKGAQTQLKTHEKIKEGYETLFEVTFDAPRHHPINPNLRDDALVLEQRLHAILLRAKEVDKKAKINSWIESNDAPTITKSGDIPETHRELLAYLNHVYTDRRIRAGRNNGWRIRITSSIPQDEFLHYWGLTKMEFKKVEYVTLRRAPLQHTSFYIAGYLLNSSEGQLLDILEEKLSEEMGCKVGIESRTAPLEKRTSDLYWNEAKQKATDAYGNIDRQKLFRNAPFAQGVYAKDRQTAVMVAGKMHKKYGKQTEDNQYPRLPDGTRLRFMLASIYLDMAGR